MAVQAVAGYAIRRFYRGRSRYDGRVWITSVLLLVLCLPLSSNAQISCSAAASDAHTYHGFCFARADTLARIELSIPSTPDRLWRGKSVTTNHNTTVVALDTAQRSYRDFRDWYKLSELSVRGDTLAFAFSPAITIEPSSEDIQILQRARTYLSDASHWSHAPDGDVAKVATQFFQKPELARGGYCGNEAKRTLFCALYQASIDVSGEYWWGRPAINAIRAAVLSDPRPGFQHPLMQFNGASDTKFEDVKRVIEVAIAFLRERQSCEVQLWVWGSPPSRLCQ